jgi:DNA-binding transcriptional MerR regulator
MKLRATGMTIQQMQQYSELQRMGDLSLPQRVEMLKSLRCQVEAHIAELNEHMNLLNFKIGIYSKIIEEQQATPSVAIEQPVSV